MKITTSKNAQTISFVLLTCLFLIGCSDDSDPTKPAPALPPSVVEEGTIIKTDHVSIDSIVFYFDKEYSVGTFANGDFWVEGPVTITRITPDFDGRNNGWEVNPVVEGDHGFQAGGYGGGFDPKLVPGLPYTNSNAVESIVKTTPSGKERPCVKSAVVLTVLDQIPPENGASVFRPPYVGEDKPLYSVTDLRTDLLPSYEPVEEMPDLKTVAGYFDKLWLDHKKGAIGRALRPADNMADYQPRNTPAICKTALRLMMDDPLEEKLPALINYVQYGIDKIHMLYNGHTWPAGGGHQPGHRLGAAFAAVMLDIERAKTMLCDAEFFHGNTCFHVGKNSDGLTLWGVNSSESNYWSYVRSHSGNRSIKDPYGYIDGGDINQGAYQVITAQSHKGEILATHLMPVLKQAWNMKEWEMIRNYTDRWVYHGHWALPDPIAGHDSTGVFESDYGPISGRPGEAFMGDGRFPEAHGIRMDGGQYRSKYVAAMWDTYRSSVPGAENRPPFVAIISLNNGDTLNEAVTTAATAFGIHGIETVEFFVDGKSIGTGEQDPPTEDVKNPPFRISWKLEGLADKEFEIQAIATDKLGNSYESAVVTFSIENGS